MRINAILLWTGLLMFGGKVQAQQGRSPLLEGASPQTASPGDGSPFSKDKYTGLYDIKTDFTAEPSILASPAPLPRISEGLATIYRQIADKYPEEKVHLHLDRDRYFAGDTLWFKGYLFNGGLPGNVSNSLYVELYRGDIRIKSKFYPVANGVTTGDMELTDSLPEGIYTIVAYTPWMANFSPSLFYAYTFPVYRPHVTPVKTSMGESVVRKFDIQFLPEGGNSVRNVFSKIAFVAVDDEGHPLDVSGWIGDESGDTVTDFHSIHDGMGAFTYIPREGKIYYAHIFSALGSKDVALPAAQPDGVVIQAKVVPEGVKVMLRSSNSSRYLGHSLSILGTMYGSPVYEATASLTEDIHVFSGTIATDHFSNGILRISVVDEDSAALAERVVFIQPQSPIRQPELRLDTLSTKERMLNKWVLHFSDSVHGTLSISVTNADAIPNIQSESNIFTDLLLTEDEDTSSKKELMGHINNPAWYFSSESDGSEARKEALDLVMLTHGWRTLKWKDVENPNLFQKISFPKGQLLEFAGRVYYGTGRKLVRNKDLDLILQSSRADVGIRTVPIDSAGRFSLKGEQFSDSAVAYFQVNEEGNKGKNVRIQLEQPQVLPVFSNNLFGMLSPARAEPDPSFQVWADRKADADIAIRRFANAKELKQIFIQGKSKARIQLQELDDRYTFGLFSNTDGFSFDMVHNPEFYESGNDPNVFSFLAGRVPSLMLKGAFPRFTFSYRGTGSPALYLNELPTSAEQLNNIPLSWIAYVKFISPPFMGAPLGGANGAIAVYLRRGDDLFADRYGLNKVTLDGYNSPRQFYAPLYSKESNSSPSSASDYRLTLDWQPSVALNDSSQDAVVRFYNNDQCRHFRIVVEGMDDSGRLVHFERLVQSPAPPSINSVATAVGQ